MGFNFCLNLSKAWKSNEQDENTKQKIIKNKKKD